MALFALLSTTLVLRVSAFGIRSAPSFVRLTRTLFQHAHRPCPLRMIHMSSDAAEAPYPEFLISLLECQPEYPRVDHKAISRCHEELKLWHADVIRGSATTEAKVIFAKGMKAASNLAHFTGSPQTPDEMVKYAKVILLLYVFDDLYSGKMAMCNKEAKRDVNNAAIF